MGADAYFYYVDYEEDKNNALQKLRQREFEAGRYAPVMDQWDIPFPLDNLLDAPKPGKKHATLKEVMKDEYVKEVGTGTILDMLKISNKLRCGCAYVVEGKDLVEHFGTDKPTREIIDENIWNYWEYILDMFEIRGAGICITIYKNNVPSELHFSGFSYD